MPLGCSTLSNKMSISQWGVCGNRSTATALIGRKGVPFTRLDGLRQRLWWEGSSQGQPVAGAPVGGRGLGAGSSHPGPPPHTHSTKLPMAARGLQETYKSRLRFSALRMARITLESEEIRLPQGNVPTSRRDGGGVG